MSQLIVAKAEAPHYDEYSPRIGNCHLRGRRILSTSSDIKPWPPTGDDLIDWEQVFESQDQGLIPLINKTKTRKGLRKRVRAIIHSMFQRKNDLENRRKFEGRMEEL